jgi:hypothetical protein
MESSTPWLAVMAIATVVQSVVIVGFAIVAFAIYRRTATALERIERDQVAPLVKRMHDAVDRIESIGERVEMMDDSVRDALHRTGDRVAKVASVVRASLWPVVGIGQGALAALHAFVARRPARPRPVRVTGRSGPRPLYEDEVARFDYEGGIDHARS